MFANARNISIEVYNEKEKYRHVKITVTDSLGKSMSYHNVTLSTGKTASGATLDSLVPSTSGGYDFVLYPWLPGDYVGDDDNPLPPDSDSRSKLIWKWLAMLDARETTTKDTYSIHMNQDRKWNHPNYNLKDKQNMTFDPATGKWTSSADIQTYSASAFISNSVIDYQMYDVLLGVITEKVKNGTQTNPDGLWSPNPLDLVGRLQDNLNNAETTLVKAIQDIRKVENRVSTLETKVETIGTKVNSIEKVLSSIISNLIDNGAWDPNATASNVDIKGAVKPGLHIAFGNINLFGGATDGNSYIRTTKGSNENDLAGGL